MHTQSLSDSRNVDHGIFFMICLFTQMVVMGPKRSSAVVMNRLIGYNWSVTLADQIKKSKHYLMQLQHTIDHAICRAPPCVVVDHKLQWSRDLAIHLNLFEIFNTLTRGANLQDRWSISIRSNWTYLDGNCWIAAITSKEPPSTQLSSRVGSNSQMACALSIVATFIIEPITSSTAKLLTCSRHLRQEWVQIV